MSTPTHYCDKCMASCTIGQEPSKDCDYPPHHFVQSAGQAGAAGAGAAARTLTQIFSDLSSSAPGSAPVARAPAVAKDLKWVGRCAEMRTVLSAFEKNVKSHGRAHLEKQGYRFPVVYGAVGIGKSRLGLEAAKRFKTVNVVDVLSEAQTESGSGGGEVGLGDGSVSFLHIFMDFSRADALLAQESGFTASLLLGIRLAAHLLGCVPAVLHNRLSETELRLLDLPSVLEHMQKSYRGVVCMLLQLDEFQKVDAGVLGDMMRALGTFMSTRHAMRVILLPYLTGTAPTDAVKEIDASSFGSEPVMLSALSGPDVQRIIEAWEVDGGMVLGRLKTDPLFTAAVASLGRVPRFVDLFLRALSGRIHKGLCGAVREDLSRVLEATRDSIYEFYSNNLFFKNIAAGEGAGVEVEGGGGEKGMMGEGEGAGMEVEGGAGGKGMMGEKTAMLSLLRAALGFEQVSLKTRLNGVTVESIRDAGLIFLEEVEGSKVFYTVAVPHVLLRVINLSLHLVDDCHLDVTAMGDADAFEKHVALIRVLRGNILYGLGKRLVKVRELYPGAYGAAKLLDSQVPLMRLVDTPLMAYGSADRHDSIDKQNAEDVKILRGAKSLSTALLINAKMAPSADAWVVNGEGQAAVFEGQQMKSSAATTRGDPAPTDGAVLTPDQVTAEFCKVNNDSHKNFYGGCDFFLALVSNKHLKGDINAFVRAVEETSEKGKQDGEEEKRWQPLPNSRGVLVVCHENFRFYASDVFGHAAVLS